MIKTKTHSNLPEPDQDSKVRSLRLQQLITQEITKNDNWLSFSKFMDLALYAPELGYYVSPSEKFGTKGDFITASNITPLFGATIARQISEAMKVTSSQIIELGAGDGSLAIDIVVELERLNSLPSRYLILDVSPLMKKKQHDLISEKVPHLLPRFCWLDDLPGQISGVVFANELFDALPVNLIKAQESEILERGVSLDEAGFCWSDRKASGQLLKAATALNLCPPYITEIGLVGRALMKKLASNLDTGILLFVDYGFRRAEYYHPQRSKGTLMCHYRHYSHQDPFFYPGLQDITAHVDFTALAEVAGNLDLEVLGYCSQAQFLINCEITDLILENMEKNKEAGTVTGPMINKLLSPGEMGELVKVIAMGNGVNASLMGFRERDRGGAL